MLALLIHLACTNDADKTRDTADTAPEPAVRPDNPTCLAPDPPATAADVSFDEVFTRISFRSAVAALQPPGDGSRWYVVEQDGQIWTWDATNQWAEEEIFLDVTDRVDDGANEAGLLGMAFHADFATNGQYFLHYTAEGEGSSPLQSRVSRFTALSATEGDADSEEILLTVDQPYRNHNGGALLWGPDDRLYISLGDGGSGGDPEENAQDTTSLLGKILRIDPDAGFPYGIPSDNPFADGLDGAPEVYAWGLRNVWRMNFDRETGDLWAGDVGQDAIEEVDLIELGGDYGWDQKEGTLCYEAAEPCDGGGYIDPVVEYGHDEGRSVVGGYVYRGAAIPELQGVYLFTDFYTNDVWGITYDEAGEAGYEVIARTSDTTVSLAEDAYGELYALSYNGGLNQLLPTGESAAAEFPDQLSETGCFEGAAPAEGLIPYEVLVPLWSDGADKERFLALPDGSTIDVDEGGDFQLPEGSVLVKTFRVDDQPIETRLFVRHEGGAWAGYTYAWDEDGADASLVVGGGAKDLGTHAWEFPTSAECLQCHGEAPGRSLGLELAQLQVGRQVARFEEMGLFSGELPEIEALPETDGDAPLEARARAYLHANCGICHQPDGLGRGDLDLRYTAAETGGCGAEPTEGDLGVAGVKVIDPGDPANSAIALRMRALDAKRMPPLASAVVDEEGVALIEAWIAAMTGCP